VRLYSALSNAGEVAPRRYRPNDPAARGTPIFGPLAAWYFNDILAEAPSPPGVLKRRNNKEISSPINRICSFPGKSGSGYRQ
jgi:membrane carboxypeptidase/penicillin-binding protein PbpC